MGRRVRACIAVVSCFIALGCAKHASAPVASSPKIPQSSQVARIIALPSGYRLKVIQVGPLYSTTTHRTLGIMLAYETDIPLSDMASLAREADGMFQYFHVDAERWGYSSAIPSATEPAQGAIITHSDGFHFIYTRGPTGAWKRTDGAGG